MIPVALRQSQQPIPYCAPNQISLQTLYLFSNDGAEYIVFAVALLPGAREGKNPSAAL
ncbi:hypothetical protein VAWG006_05190 [Aeromonas enteropelogenes]|nr:hypothetical protein VAWG006_05190 [Aeromonas enteropelogenes]BEE20427.1 hypothetical protein VAWG007_05220 [Aeromonas enteropelogenes]